MSMHTLYISYFGLREPLVQTQVLPYLRQLQKDRVRVSLLTFEPRMRSSWPREELSRRRQILSGEGIRWHALPYHKRFSLPAKLFDIAAGALCAARLVRTEKIDVVHARGHVAALMGTFAKRISGGRLIFDIRGFMPEEYVDAGLWRRGGLLYRWTKRVENRMLARADGFVVLTERAREILFPGCEGSDPRGRPVEVIPCCVDLERFRAANETSKAEARERLRVRADRVLIYVGSLDGWYLSEELARFVAIASRNDPSTFTLILTQSPADSMIERLDRLGVERGCYMLRKVPSEEVPLYLRSADLAVCFVKPCYSKLSSSPTKIAEYLACGIPVVCNSRIGDVDELLQREKVGILVDEFSDAALTEALRQAERLLADPETRQRCVATAHRCFGLENVGGPRYRRLYRRLAGGASSGDMRGA